MSTTSPATQQTLLGHVGRMFTPVARALVCTLLLCGNACTMAGEYGKGSDPSPMPPPSSGGMRQTDPDYKLSAGDLLVVDMYDQKDINTSQRLTATGEIRLPLIGRVSLLDLTVREAELRIETMFREGGFFIDPQIILFVQQYAERYISVFGQVRTPSRIPLPEESNSLGILQAVTLAGGFTRIARTDAVQISRTNANGVEERFTVDVRDLLKVRRGSDKREFQLIAGDVVFIPERTL